MQIRSIWQNSMKTLKQTVILKKIVISLSKWNSMTTSYIHMNPYYIK